MLWDENKGTFSYFGKAPIDMDSPIRIGEKAKLSKEDYIFEVEITDINNQVFKGNVLTIGEIPTLEALGIKRGDEVTFNESNIKVLYRK